jgi:hypothetical protein
LVQEEGQGDGSEGGNTLLRMHLSAFGRTAHDHISV